jgi:hypothetical protein
LLRTTISKESETDDRVLLVHVINKNNNIKKIHNNEIPQLFSPSVGVGVVGFGVCFCRNKI